VTDKRDTTDDWGISHALVHYGLLIPVVIITVCAGLFLPAMAEVRSGNGIPYLISALCLAVIGIATLFAARLPLYRQRRFFTIGPWALDRTHQRLHAVAYGFIVPSVLLLSLLLLITR
jgi:hypothetical protein